MGYACSLPERELEALVEMARFSVKENRDIDRADHAALDNYHKMRRKTNEEDELDSLFTQYAMALSFSERCYPLPSVAARSSKRQIADGEKDKQSARCKKLLPAGALRICWPEDTEFDESETYVWTILKPTAFNKDIHLGWRFAACELQRMQHE
ncbi:hypothetical protein AB1Y20_016708 [Prymnesium parvum]|uniref:Uncharacterized protein n=1 Tax=Prymnesium parvum TaxID=97485 RepID=A0AB34IBV0_PRYPA